MLTQLIMVSALALPITAAGQEPVKPSGGKEDARVVSLQGRVISATDVMLIMAQDNGEEMKYTLSDDTRILIDGKAAKPAVLKPGMNVRVTSAPAAPTKAITIEIKQPR